MPLIRVPNSNVASTRAMIGLVICELKKEENRGEAETKIIKKKLLCKFTACNTILYELCTLYDLDYGHAG